MTLWPSRPTNISVTLFSDAHLSNSFEMNSGLLSPLKTHGVTCIVIGNRQCSKSPPGDNAVSNEIHRPALIWFLRRWHYDSDTGSIFAPSFPSRFPGHTWSGWADSHNQNRRRIILRTRVKSLVGLEIFGESWLTIIIIKERVSKCLSTG